MKLTSFRIKNFRSIVDTGWCRFSHDGTTVLVGQNESGKSSVLEAIGKTFSDGYISDDDCRSNAPLPEMFLQILLTPGELDTNLAEFHSLQVEAINEAIQTHNKPLTMRFGWRKKPLKENSEYEASYRITDDEFEETLKTVHDSLKKKIENIKSGATVEKLINAALVDSNQTLPEVTTEDTSDEIEKFIDIDELTDAVFQASPYFVLFDSNDGLLPNSVDIEDGKLIGSGKEAARNFLKIANISLKKLVESDPRTRTHLLKRANERISKDFLEFWTQTIGHSEQLELECELEFYSNQSTTKSGQPYLVFWISDGFNRLYPKQRSLGVRWFISFYLQIRASEKSKAGNIFLLDEPGANLHAKAQADVLALINQLSPHINIIYSTHSPNLIEYQRLYRVYAVQRKGDEEDSPTVLIDAQHLGTASTDTLSPILTAMGADFSNQNVIQKRNNVILEEMSGFYYLHSFWKLTKCSREAYFIAATGVNKIEGLANMFRGWGLDFIIALDDDPQGRSVYNNLRRELYGDIETLVKDNVYKFTDCKGIEDAFSSEDFRKYVLKDESILLDSPNSEIIKRDGRSKPISGYMFMIDVQKGNINWEMLDAISKARIQKIVDEIGRRLDLKDGQ